MTFDDSHAGRVRPSADDPRWAKVLVPLEQDEYGYPPATGEWLWTTPVDGGGYEVHNVPFLRAGYCRIGHCLRGARPGRTGHRRVLRPSGHSTVRLLLQQQPTPEVLEPLTRLGVTYETFGKIKLVALDIPRDVSYGVIRGVLLSGLEAEMWQFEEASIADDHWSEVKDQIEG